MALERQIRNNRMAAWILWAAIGCLAFGPPDEALGGEGQDSPIVLLDVYTDPSPAIHGGDFSLVFVWNRVPASARIRIFDPSGTLKYDTTRAQPGIEQFPTRLYVNRFEKRGWYRVEVSGYQGAAQEAFEFALMDRHVRGARWQYTLTAPSRKEVYFRENTRVRLTGFIETQMPVNVWLVWPDGRQEFIGRPQSDEKGLYAEFDSWALQRFIAAGGLYRLRVQPVLAGKKYASRFSEPFRYFPYPRQNVHRREVFVDGRRFIYVNAAEHGGEAGDFKYYMEMKDGSLAHIKYFADQAEALSAYMDESGQHFVALSYPLKVNEQVYRVYALVEQPDLVKQLPKGRTFWLNEENFRKAGLAKVIILDEENKTVSDKELAARLFRASGIGYYARNVKKAQLGFQAYYVTKMKRLTEDPVIVAVFAVQGAKSRLQDISAGGSAWPIRYHYAFLDMMVADANATGLSLQDRQAVLAAIKIGNSSNRVATLLGPLAKQLPSQYVTKLDENWNLVLQGQQYHFMRRPEPNSSDVGLVLDAAKMLVEFTNTQIVLRDRGDCLRSILPVLEGQVDPQVLAGLKAALVKADQMYVHGFEHAVDKMATLAIDKGVDAATASLAKASSKAHMALLAFEINNLIFNMDGMYELALKAQCAAAISEELAKVSASLEQQTDLRGRSAVDIDVLEQLDRLYYLRLLARAEFHRYVREFHDVTGVGKEVANVITQGGLYRELQVIAGIEADSKEAAQSWGTMPGATAALSRLQPDKPTIDEARIEVCEPVFTREVEDVLSPLVDAGYPIDHSVDSAQGFFARMKCPADLHIYDSRSRHVGIDYETGEWELEIPGAEHVTVGEADYVFVLGSLDNYRVMTKGRQAGTYTLDIIRPVVIERSDGVLERVLVPFRYQDIPTTSGQERTHEQDVVALGHVASSKLGEMDTSQALRAAMRELGHSAAGGSHPTASGAAQQWDIGVLAAALGIAAVSGAVLWVLRRRKHAG